ncbi:MAG: restriction endonuclease subunit S [Faecalibacterium sp.]|jgi:type I restriction enzyme S subunit
MKSEWRTVALGSVADLTVGFVGTMASNYTETGIPFLRSTNIEPFDIKLDDIKYISSNFNESLRKSELHPNDVVIVRTGTPGACAVIPAGVKAWNCSDLVIVRPHRNKLNPLFLASYVNLASGVINTQLVGAVQQHYNVGAAKKMQIPLPPIGEQDKIASIIGMLNKKITINSKINDNLEQQAATYFQELFINNANPVWQISTISDLGTVVGGSTPSKTKPEYYTNNGIAWITPKDLSINKSKFISHGENDITELGLKNSSATVMPKGTVLFSSRAPIGYIAIASNEVTTNQGFKSVIPYSEIGTAFVYFFLKHSLPVIESAASGSTFKEISGSAMKNIPAIIPDRNTLDQFNSFCAPIFAQQKILEEQNHSLAMLRDSLLPKLMSGAIDIASIQL